MFVSTIDELKQAIQENHYEIICQKGVYRFSEPILLQNQQKMTIKGEKGAIFKGTLLVDEPWSLYDKNIYVTTIQKGLTIQALYVNDVTQIMARYPNEQEGQRLRGCCDYETLVTRAKNYKNPSTGYVRAIHDREWGGNSYFLKGVQGDDLTLEWIGDNNRGSLYRKTEMMIENIFEELDSPKEWFYNSETGALYVYFDDKYDESFKVEVAVTGEAFRINNSSDIIFENIDFRCFNRMMFHSAYRLVTRSDWGIADKSLIFAENSKNITIKQCNFDEIGANVIYFKGKNENHLVERCEFTNTGASGVLMYGDPSACRHLSNWENDDHKIDILDKTIGPQNEKYVKNCTVSNCYFYNTGIFEKQSAPISLSVAHKITVQSNTIHNVPRAGINICDGSFGGHIIKNNDIFDTILESGDHGPFNSWGRDRFWSYLGFDTRGGLGEDKKPFSKLDAMDTTILDHNRIVGTRGFGIDLDDGSTNYLITNNFCYGVGIKLREGFYRTVKNNFIIGAPLDLHCTFSGNDDIIENNVVFSNQPIRCIQLNEGFTTKLQGNLFIGAEENLFQLPIFEYSQNLNFIEKMDFATAMNMMFQTSFQKFSLDFGVDNKPKPTLHTQALIMKTHKINFQQAVISNIDESIRTFGGLESNHGVYIEKSSDYFEHHRIQKGDVLLKIDEHYIRNIDDFIRYQNNMTVLIVMRNQKKITLNNNI